MNTMGLLVTLGLGVFILIGAALVFLLKNSTKLIEFSIGLAFGIMILLLLFDIVPEALEMLGETGNSTLPWIILIVGFVCGFVLLKILDFFIPDHDHHPHHDHDTKEAQENLFHIGLVSSIAVILHNIIEGMAVYGTVTTSLSTGILMCVGIGLHNIPLGMAITSTSYQSHKDKKKTFILVSIIALSTFVGGLFMFVFKAELLNHWVLGSLLSITSGMLLYIILMELLPHMMDAKEKKYAYLGVVVGVLLIIISTFFGGHSH